MEIDSRISGVEIDYRYANCVRGRGPERTLRISVEGPIDSTVAGELFEKVNRYFDETKKLFDHISIVSVASDWPADKAERARPGRELLELLRGLGGDPS